MKTMSEKKNEIYAQNQQLPWFYTLINPYGLTLDSQVVIVGEKFQFYTQISITQKKKKTEIESVWRLNYCTIVNWIAKHNNVS